MKKRLTRKPLRSNSGKHKKLGISWKTLGFFVAILGVTLGFTYLMFPKHWVEIFEIGSSSASSVRGKASPSPNNLGSTTRSGTTTTTNTNIGTTARSAGQNATTNDNATTTSGGTAADAAAAAAAKRKAAQARDEANAAATQTSGASGCKVGDTKSCTIGGCAGVQICAANGVFTPSCVKTDNNCIPVLTNQTNGSVGSSSESRTEISKCTAGQTKDCTIGGCAGIQVCAANGVFTPSCVIKPGTQCTPKFTDPTTSPNTLSESTGASCKGAFTNIASGAWAQTGAVYDKNNPQSRACMQCKDGVWVNSNVKNCDIVNYIPRPDQVAEDKDGTIMQACWRGDAWYSNNLSVGDVTCSNGKWVSTAEIKKAQEEAARKAVEEAARAAAAAQHIASNTTSAPVPALANVSTTVGAVNPSTNKNTVVKITVENTTNANCAQRTTTTYGDGHTSVACTTAPRVTAADSPIHATSTVTGVTTTSETNRANSDLNTGLHVAIGGFEIGTGITNNGTPSVQLNTPSIKKIAFTAGGAMAGAGTGATACFVSVIGSWLTPVCALGGAVIGGLTGSAVAGPDQNAQYRTLNSGFDVAILNTGIGMGVNNEGYPTASLHLPSTETLKKGAVVIGTGGAALTGASAASTACAATIIGMPLVPACFLVGGIAGGLGGYYATSTLLPPEQNNIETQTPATQSNLEKKITTPTSGNTVSQLNTQPITTSNQQNLTTSNLTSNGAGPCQRNGNSYCDGSRMYTLYEWYKTHNGWWNQNGTDQNYTPAKFMATMLIAESNGDPELLDAITLATSNQLWGTVAGGRSPYCTSQSNCEAGALNFTGAYMQSAGMRYNNLLSNGKPENDPSTWAGYYESLKKSGITLDTIANEAVYNQQPRSISLNDPTDWGAPESAAGNDNNVANRDPSCAVYYAGGGDVVYSLNQIAAWNNGKCN